VSLWRDTIAALAAPRRLAAILVVSLPLIGAQALFSSWRGSAVWVAVVMVVGFLAVGPWSWRLLFPPRLPRNANRPARLVAYAALGALPAALAYWAPRLLGIEETFLGAWVNAFVCAGLFWVGGWGLAREIEQERGLAAAEARAESALREAERAQLLAVQSHLDPHFLFNTLNAIAEWTREDPEVAERAILRLSGLLREVLGGIRSDRWPLERELRLAADVWELHLIRDPSWFSIEWPSGPVPAVEVPPMILLPLVENAVKHGPARGHRGTIALRVRSDAGGLTVSVHSPGPWGGARDGSVGLSMVERRLFLAYGQEARLEAGPEGAGSVAAIHWRAP
jgi:signal transduction histidine kinase